MESFNRMDGIKRSFVVALLFSCTSTHARNTFGWARGFDEFIHDLCKNFRRLSKEDTHAHTHNHPLAIRNFQIKLHITYEFHVIDDDKLYRQQDSSQIREKLSMNYITCTMHNAIWDVCHFSFKKSAPFVQTVFLAFWAARSQRVCVHHKHHYCIQNRTEFHETQSDILKENSKKEQRFQQQKLWEHFNTLLKWEKRIRSKNENRYDQKWHEIDAVLSRYNR